jgi:hypothetical protein
MKPEGWGVHLSYLKSGIHATEAGLADSLFLVGPRRNKEGRKIRTY